MGRPQAFREFLLSAPVMFTDLGERLGAVSHIVSFWNFRFPPHDAPAATVGELLDLFTDFSASLSTADASDDGPDGGVRAPRARADAIADGREFVA